MAPRDHFRAHGRRLVQIDATLREHDGAPVPVIIRNLGFGGAGVDLADPTTRPSTQDPSRILDLAIDASVELEIVTPALWDPLHLRGSIAWIRPASPSARTTRAGIRFDPLSATTLRSLFDVLCAY